MPLFDAGEAPRRSTSSLGPNLKPNRPNPYAPPFSVVADIDRATRPQTMPRIVAAAIGLIAGEFLIGAVQVTLMNLGRGSYHVAFGVSLAGLIGSLWIYGLYRRHNWVRWLAIVSAGLGVLGVIWGPSRFSNPWQVLLERIQVVAHLTAAILLCLPAAGYWYGRRSASPERQ